MINKDELIFCVDENNNPMESVSRQQAHANDIWHRISHIWVINRKKGILCQKRSLLKDNNPGKWEAFFGGHIAANEENIDNAVKELQEETKLKIDKNQFHFVTLGKDTESKHFQAAFYVIWNGKSKDIALEKEEVSEIKWISINELSRILLTERRSDWVHVNYEKQIINLIKTLN